MLCKGVIQPHRSSIPTGAIVLRIAMKKKDIGSEALKLHKKLGGKIRTGLPMHVTNREQLSLIYTPGVGAVSSYIATHKSEAKHYTIRGKMIAVISDGSAVLGLGNIGPEAALPVMEGKAAPENGFSLLLNSQ